MAGKGKMVLRARIVAVCTLLPMSISRMILMGMAQ